MTYSKDYELVRAIQNGDRLSRLALFTVYKRLVKRVAKMALLPQDFEQEAFEMGQLTDDEWEMFDDEDDDL